MLSALGKSPLLAALVSGALIGVLSLIKPHALALALGSSLFLLLQDRRRVNGVFGAFIVFISYYFIRTVLAYVLTGRWLFSVAGSTYATTLGSGYHVDFWATAVNTLGHICAVAILIAVPLTITIVLVFQRILGRTEVVNPPIDRITDLGLLACCMLAAMLAMTVYYTPKPVSAQSVRRAHHAITRPGASIRRSRGLAQPGRRHHRRFIFRPFSRAGLLILHGGKLSGRSLQTQNSRMDQARNTGQKNTTTAYRNRAPTKNLVRAQR
jgi:hypothetical protein